MSFKDFYIKDPEEYIFNDTFEKYYKNGHFGDIEKNVIKEQQLIWFNKFIKIINERNESELIYALSNVENKLTREWFSLLTGYNIKFQTKNKALLLIKEFIYGNN